MLINRDSVFGYFWVVFIFSKCMFIESHDGKQQLKHVATLCIKLTFIGPEKGEFCPILNNNQ